MFLNENLQRVKDAFTASRLCEKKTILYCGIINSLVRSTIRYKIMYQRYDWTIKEVRK